MRFSSYIGPRLPGVDALLGAVHLRRHEDDARRGGGGDSRRTGHGELDHSAERHHAQFPPRVLQAAAMVMRADGCFVTPADYQKHTKLEDAVIAGRSRPTP